MKVHAGLLSLSLLFAASGSALADTVVLNFEGIIPAGSQSAPVGNFYDGGGGTNYGITFSSNALAVCLNTPGVNCSNASRGGQGDPNSQSGGLFFLSGTQTYLDDAAGFNTGFSLFYSTITDPGSLSVYSGLDGTGTLLGSLNLPVTPSDCPSEDSASYCPFVPVGLSFSGTAESISFAGVENQIAFDDITFGNATPGVPTAPSETPEPSSLLLLGTGMLGTVGLYRRKLSRSV